MDTKLLVEKRIEDGQRLIDQLVRDGVEVRCASWIKTSEEGYWRLYIASPSFDPEKAGEAFQTAYASFSKIPDMWDSPSEICPINGTNLIARAVLEVRDRHAGKGSMRYHGTRLGNLAIEEAYIYPPPGKWFQGFDEIKQNFPSAEVFTLPVLFEDALHSLRGGDELMGCVNAEAFEGKAPGTLLCIGPKGGSSKPVAELIFVHRPEGWNALYRADTGQYEQVRQVITGEPLYKFADFSPLVGLKTAKKPGDQYIDQMKKKMEEGYFLSIPPDDTPIYSIPFTPPEKPDGEVAKPIGWEDIRRILEEGGWVNIHAPAKIKSDREAVTRV